MDQMGHEILVRRHRRQGIWHFVFFFVLIWGGIITKRVFGHPEYMMLFHGPAAVFLVMSGIHLTWHQRQQLNRLKERLARDKRSSHGFFSSEH